jgi:aminoglycoside phosphotransferase (APT) family kinase protein
LTNPNLAEKATWKVVSPPPTLAVGEIDALLAAWRGGRRLLEVEPLAGGIMNWNYRVRLTGSPDRFVLRFYDRMPASCAKETRLLELLCDDVPVPRVHFVSSDGANGRPPFCVLEWIDGISLRELRRRGDDRGVAEASYDAGRLLPRLMRHRFDRGGLLDSSLAVTDGPFTNASLIIVVEQFTSSAQFRRRVDEPLCARLHAFLRATESLHTPTGPATLVHGDFNSPNIFVHQVGGRWTVAAMLDWEFAFAGSILCDVGNMLRYECAGRPRYEPYFSRGLADGGWPLPDEWFLRARLADLPALCELLARDDVPDAIVAELLDLLRGTIGDGTG